MVMNTIVVNYRKYGVPLSDLMDPETLQTCWNQVDLETESQNVAVTTRLSNLMANYQTNKVMFENYKVSMEAYLTSEQSVITAAAAQQGNTQFGVLKSQSLAITTMIESSTLQLDTLKKGIL